MSKICSILVDDNCYEINKAGKGILGRRHNFYLSKNLKEVKARDR